MFGKSLKYEFKAVSRKIVPLFITEIVISVLIGITFIIDGRVLASVSEDKNSSEVGRIVDLMQGIFAIGLFMMILVLSIAVFVMMIKRFYSSFFTDEGYLTFTLPVSIDCHLITKIVSVVIWSFFSIVVTFLSYLIIGGGMEIGHGTISEITSQVGEMFPEIEEEVSFIWNEQTTFALLSFLYNVMYFIMEILLLYFGISLGCMLSKKHRVIASIGCIIGICIVFSIADDLISKAASISSEPYVLIISLMVFMLVKMILLYLGTKTILVKKLNLD